MSALKNFIKRYGSALAAFAMMIATVTANSTCIFYAYQDEMPDSAKKLRRF